MKGKPFKETKLGSWLATNAPKALAVVGDVLPDKGVLGVLKNIIDSTPDIPQEQRLEFEKLCYDHEQELYALEVQDRDSARKRETEFAKSVGHSDYMVWFLSGALIMSFFFIVWHLVKASVPNENRELVTNIVGIIEGLLISIYSYYFGSSMGSRIKDMKPR
jgi:hypothetical protein